jgi:hypothetical protein
MKSAPAKQPCACRHREALFYCVELLDGSELTAILFFDANQLESAKREAITAIQSGVAESARIIDDQSRLIFRPALRAPTNVVQFYR